MSARTQYIEATADTDFRYNGNGVAVTGSYQSTPVTDTPFKVRGNADTAKTKRRVEIALTRDEAQKLVEDWISFGLFGRHGRIETKAAS